MKDDLGKIDAKLAGKQSCVKAPEQMSCADGSQLGLDNQCHQICAMGGIAWPAGQCCAAGSVVSVSGKCCPPGSKIDAKSGQCNPPAGCLPGNVKVGGSCCPTENVGLQVKLGAKNFVCCPSAPDPNTGYCLPPAIKISACDAKQLTPDKKTCCPAGQKPGDGGDSNTCVCTNSMKAPVDGVCKAADPCAVAGACDPTPLQLVCAPGLVANPAAVGLGDKAKDPCLCPDGSTPPKDGSACPISNVADQILNQFAKCPDGKPMLPDKVCVIEAKLCAAAGPGAVPNPDIIIHGGDGKACCPANYKPVAGMGWCANGPLPFCDPDKNQALDKNDHVCKCAGGKPLPPNGVCPQPEALSACFPGLVKKGGICVCPNTGKPPVKKPGGNPICDPDDSPVATCTTGFAASNDGACCRRNLLTAGGQCCTGGLVPGVNRAACVPPSCGPGKHWDFDKKACLADVVAVPGCGAGTHWDPGKSACVSNQPSCRPGSHWDARQSACVADPQRGGAGTHLDPGRSACVSDAPPSCRGGSHWDPGKKSCVSDQPSCRGGSHWDPGSKTCVSDRPIAQRCGAGTHWDAGRRTCVSDGSKPKPKADVQGSKPKPKANVVVRPPPRPVARPFSNRRQRNQ